MGEYFVSGALIGDPLRAFPYIGGKSKLVNWLYECFPKEFTSLWDVCGGSGAVSLSLVPVVYNRKVAEVHLNDYDRSIYNFYRTLKGERGGELEERLLNLEYSKLDWLVAHSSLTYLPMMDSVEAAVDTYIEIVSSFSGMRQHYVKKDIEMLAHMTKKNIPRIREKLQHIEVTNMDFQDILDCIDDPKAFVYIDVPYRMTHRCGKALYKEELSGLQHFKMIERLKAAPYRWALSGYAGENGVDDLYDVLLKDFSQYRTEKPVVKACGGGKKKSKAKEILWRNYSN